MNVNSPAHTSEMYTGKKKIGKEKLRCSKGVLSRESTSKQGSSPITNWERFANDDPKRLDDLIWNREYCTSPVLPISKWKFFAVAILF